MLDRQWQNAQTRDRRSSRRPRAAVAVRGPAQPVLPRIWTAQLVSTIGDALTSLAAGIIVYERTGSALSVGLMLMATAVPTLVVGLIAGVVVDRYDRKKIMIASDLIRAGLVATLPFLLSSTGSVVWLYVVVMLSSSVTQFFSPANESVLPEIASEEELGAANAIMAIAQFGSTAVGFAAAGFLATTKSIELVFYIDSATFLFSALMISLVRIAPLEVTEHTTLGEQIRNIGFGAKFIWKTPILRSLNIVRVPVLIAFGMQNVLLLPFAIHALKATEFEYGLQEGLTSVGFVIGSLLMARLADRLREGQWLVLSFVAMGADGPRLLAPVDGLGGDRADRHLRGAERAVVRRRAPRSTSATRRARRAAASSPLRTCCATSCTCRAWRWPAWPTCSTCGSSSCSARWW